MTEYRVESSTYANDEDDLLRMGHNALALGICIEDGRLQGRVMDDEAVEDMRLMVRTFREGLKLRDGAITKSVAAYRNLGISVLAQAQDTDPGSLLASVFDSSPHMVDAADVFRGTGVNKYDREAG
tara:strand:- start:12037 stop:12414 length:378 start_codon:yes stop_codon:yes gene_type:complete